MTNNLSESPSKAQGLIAWFKDIFLCDPVYEGEPCECCGRPLLRFPYCRCDYLGFTRTEAERRRQRIRSVIGASESGRA